MGDSEIYKGWVIREAKSVVQRILADGRRYAAFRVEDSNRPTISGPSIESIKVEIDKIDPQEKIPVGNIDWRKIEEIPDRLKDGRDVLLYFPLEGLSDTHPKVIIGWWNKKLGVWVWQNRSVRAYSDCYQPNYYAEINLPE